MRFKSKQFISRFMAVVLFVCMLMGNSLATVGSYIMNPVIVKAATEISILNLPDYPSNGQKYWVIFKEGYRNGRIEMSTCNANASDGVWIKWNRSLTLQGAQTDGQVNQYRLSDENSWEQIGTYGRFTDWATEVIASNLNIYDSDGNMVLKGIAYNTDFSKEKMQGLTRLGEHYYKVFDNGLTWTEAKRYCESIGGHLATITSEVEQKHIEEILSSKSKFAYWLGANDEQTENIWKWVTGEKWNYNNWDISGGQPDNYNNNEHYLQIYKNYQAVYKWNDAADDNRNHNLRNSPSIDSMGFICEWENIDDLRVTLEDELLYKTKLYTSDGGDVYKRVLEGLNEKLSRDDIATEDKIAMLNNFYKLFNITDIQEGTAYCIEAMNGKRAYDFLTNDENFLAYQFKNYLQNTAPGTIARGLMITDGWIFNNELKQWIDPKTYLMQETQSIKNYKEMLLDFMNYTEDGNILSVTSDVSNYFDNVQKFVESIADSLSDETLAKFESEKSKCTTPEAINDLMKKYDIVEKKKIYSVKGFDELGRIFESAGIVYQITGDSADDILAFISLESKLETISFYKKFLEMIYDGEDYLPTDLRIAAKQLYEQAVKPYYFQITDLISNLVYDIKKSSLNIAMYSLNFSEVLKYEIKPAIKSKYPKIFTDEVTDTIGTFGDAMAVIEASAFVVNLLTNVTDVVNKAYHSEAYAFLGTYFSHVLNESKNQFNANQTIENAWDFYDKYHLLFRIRVCGENAYLKMCEEKTMTKILAGVMFKYFDVKDRKKYVEDTFKYMDEYCFFGLENADQIPESHKFAQKAVIKCPVDVEIYDNSGKLVYTIFDGKEIDDTNTFGRFICKYDPKFGEYIKIVCLNNPDKYMIKSVGVDYGNVNIETAVVGTDNAVTASKVTGLPIEKNGIITLDIKTGNYTDDQNGDGSNEYTGKLQETDTDEIIFVHSIKLSDETVALKVGEKKVVGVTINPTNATFTDVVWESSDESIAVVENGAIMGISAGEVKITVSTSDRKITAFCTVTVKPNGVLGDTNGDESVDIADALMIARYDAGLIQFDETQLSVSDVNRDDSVDIADALMIARYDAGLISSL